MDQPAQVDSPSDFGDTPAAAVSRWISELELSEKDQAAWVSRGRRIVRRYVDDRAEANDTRKRRFALPSGPISRRW